MRLVAYLRVSSESGLDGFSLDIQRRAVTTWARTNRHQIAESYTDQGVSGAKDATDRPGLSAALAALRQPATAHGLVVYRLDRLARALTVQEAVLAMLWRERAQVFSVEAGQIHKDDPEDPMRTAMRQVVGVFAELERRTVVKRLRDGRNAKAATGRKAVGGYPYGYEATGKGRHRDAAPKAAEQRTIDEILRQRREGASYREIAAHLDSTGHKPRRANRWSAMSVRNIALRETG